MRIVRHDSTGPFGSAARLGSATKRTQRNEGARVPAVARRHVGPLEGTSFSRNGPDCAHRWRPRSIGRIVSSTLVAIVILDVPFDVGGAHDDSTISRLPAPPATPGSCFLRCEAMILPARTLYTCGRTDTTNMPRAIRRACRSFTPRHVRRVPAHHRRRILLKLRTPCCARNIDFIAHTRERVPRSLVKNLSIPGGNHLGSRPDRVISG